MRVLGKRSVGIAIAAVVALICGAFAFVLAKWPFTKEAVGGELGQLLGASVEQRAFRSVYFPHPGCVVEGIAFHGPKAIGSIRKLTVEAAWTDLLTGRKRIERIRAEGLYARVPGAGEAPAAKKSGGSQLAVGELIADGSVLEVQRGSGAALRFEIHKLTLDDLAAGRAWSFRASLKNPLPPGEVTCSGTFGPWNSGERGKTPLSGAYDFERADLGVFQMLGGTLSSKGKFNGILERVDVRGGAEVRDFYVKSSGHRVQLAAQFHAIVNGTNGDTALQPADTRFETTTIDSEGAVEGRPGERGKTVSLEMTARDGRIQDLMHLLMKSERAPLAGAIDFRARATLPPGKEKFLRKVELEGDFGIGGARFTGSQTRHQIDVLSERARGEKDADANPENVVSGLKGHVALKDGVARFSALSFTVPGALVRLQGTYSLLTQRIDLHGTLAMQADLSQATKGVKSFLLKALDPFFKKKRAGAVVPIQIGGTYSHPSYGVSLEK